MPNSNSTKLNKQHILLLERGFGWEYPLPTYITIDLVSTGLCHVRLNKFLKLNVIRMCASNHEYSYVLAFTN